MSCLGEITWEPTTENWLLLMNLVRLPQPRTKKRGVLLEHARGPHKENFLYLLLMGEPPDWAIDFLRKTDLIEKKVLEQALINAILALTFSKRYANSSGFGGGFAAAEKLAGQLRGMPAKFWANLWRQKTHSADFLGGLLYEVVRQEPHVVEHLPGEEFHPVRDAELLSIWKRRNSLVNAAILVLGARRRGKFTLPPEIWELVIQA